MKITENNPTTPSWLSTRENSVESVLYLFATISKKFELDPQYGKEWVKQHPETIASLVNAAMFEVSEKKAK